MNDIKDIAFPFGKDVLFFKIRDQGAIYNRNVGSDRLVLREIFGEQIYPLAASDFAGSGIFVDLGANIGATSVYAKALGARDIYAWEPVPENYELLIRNLELNRVTANTSQKAIWQEESVIRIVSSQASSTSEPAIIEQYPNHIIEAETITLEKALEPFREVDVLKCDIEGAEYGIFGNPAVNAKIRKIVMEFHNTTIDKFGAMVANLVLTHNVQMFGKWNDYGGQIVANRY